MTVKYGVNGRMRTIIVGAGAMGLAAGYHAAAQGHEVTVLEAGPVPGGMAAHFDFGGVSLERFYHFICRADTPTFTLLDELGIADTLHWRPTSMGYFADGKLYRWGDPVSLLRFPKVSLLARLRYGVFALVSTRRETWPSLEHRTAREWIASWVGEKAYRTLWEPLFRLKFYEHADHVSAAWIWTRIKRIGRSRRSMFQEELGYLEGGSETLVEALQQGIERHGGSIRLREPVQRVEVENGRVVGVVTPSGRIAADAVILTVPTPLVSTMVPDLPADWKARYDAIENIGVCCLVFKLRRSISPHFWINISDPAIAIPGLVEFSNLRPMDDTVVFVPYYMPVTHPKWAWSDEDLLAEAFGFIKRINPEITDTDLLTAQVSRLTHAQPVCGPDFAETIPPVQTPITGLQIADTSFYYPEDRGISESVRFGRMLADHLGDVA